MFPALSFSDTFRIPSARADLKSSILTLPGSVKTLIPERFILFKGLFCQKWNRGMLKWSKAGRLRIQAALAYTFVRK